jgi:hypothetical protein
MILIMTDKADIYSYSGNTWFESQPSYCLSWDLHGCFESIHTNALFNIHDHIAFSLSGASETNPYDTNIHWKKIGNVYIT